MADSSELEKDAAVFAQRAVKCDQEQLFDTAMFYYVEAGQALLSALQVGSRIPSLMEKANEYLGRAEVLKASKGTGGNFNMVMKTEQQINMDRAKFLVEKAFEEDEQDNNEEACELYMQAVELCLTARKEAQDADLQSKLTRLAEQALSRAEELKSNAKSSSTPLVPSPSPRRAVTQQPPAATGRSVRPLGDSLFDDDDRPANRGAANKPRPTPTTGGYTKEEIAVLRITSRINGRDYVPFLAVDMRERFAYPVPFTDKHGKLALAPKQREKFGKWARPDEFIDNAQMIYAISSFSIKQTLISDCSFVASLAISAQYERRFKKQLITSIIYPQNRKGEPQYNPCGKYMIKLNLNGVPRKVIVDDYLPLGRNGELLCSYSNNRNELWVSLLEKAYMKVMGGYDFPGSNSNIDLHALTGWIPERVAIRPGSSEFDAQKEFDRLFDKFHKGHCLITLATGEMSDDQADRAGLVETHAYALLDIRRVKGYNLFQLKNPWSHLRWRGNFSELDTLHWTNDMKQALNFDPKSASMYDNGIFWIDYESILKFYDVIYINWNPDLFPHTTCVHDTWTAKEGPKKDAYNIGDNPQFKLVVQANGPSAVWILLTRHITDKDDFAHNKEFITVLVYKSQGKRIFYPYDPSPYKDGVRINSPHYLCKMVEEKGTHTFTLVVSQYEKSNTIHYTLRVYASCPLSLTKIAEPYISKFEKQVTGQWKGKSAGGCANDKTSYAGNPIYQLHINNNSTNNQVMIELKGPREYSVGFDVVSVEQNVSSGDSSFKKKSSGSFRPGFCVLEIENIPGGIYNIIPCTFYSGKEGPFFLNISSSASVTLKQVQ